MTPLLLALAACGPSDTTVGSGDKDITVPAGDGIVELSADSFTWTDLVIGYSTSQQLSVTSVGEGTLQVYEAKLVTNTDGAFYFDEVEDIELEPTQEASWSVVANLDKGWDLSTYASGTLRLRTNDVDCGEALIPLTAIPEGYTGDPPPQDTAEAGGACQ